VARREPTWIDRTALLALHAESLAEFGGASGLRDEGLFDSALARPQQRFVYGRPDLAELAAAYAYGLAKNHPFVDGNKRCAFIALGLFLAINGERLTATPAEATLAMLAVAAGDLDEQRLTEWIRSHSVKSRPTRAKR